MTDVQLILIVALPLLLLVGVPIYAAIGLVGFAASWTMGSDLVFAAQSIFNGVDNFALLAIPAFILAGNIMEKGGLTHDIIRIFRKMFGHVHGSLGIITILSCMFFAAISGSGPGTVAAIGSIMIPSMIRYGYPAPYAASITATGGSLGILIPPSNPMIIYAIIANVSIADVFAAGMIPGLLMGIVLVATGYFTAKRSGAVVASIHEEEDGSDSLGSLIWKAKFALFLPILVLGGIYSGLFTPVEASVVAVAYAFLVAKFVYSRLNIAALNDAFVLTHKISGALMIVVACSALLAKVITFEMIPQQLSEAMSEISTNPLIILLLINIFLIFIGTFMETMSAIIILAPILVPLVTSLGINPVHFGIILMVNTQIAFLTPPLGVNLFVASQISQVPIEKISRAILPFLFALLSVLALVTLVPQLSLALPEFLRSLR
ncbi:MULTISPECIES: TRAP transporter large permease [Halomonadaceae]|uniref:TRAP transporter large permease protein n=2 Tax=Vreelandella TaxID=3137766 RepID=A0A7Z0LTF8_9GAMM|nr:MULTISPECIES: TRAP transporter large permease [Halomonas]NYS78279.1 TRAP transporter large permease [Halomonas glaciei]|tara:strand:- start:2614 stop:3915 length:1302 start_codon:yes stop_codon:yes gene_type:complete